MYSTTRIKPVKFTALLMILGILNGTNLIKAAARLSSPKPDQPAQRSSRWQRDIQGVYKARIIPHWFVLRMPDGTENTCFWYRNNLSDNLGVVQPECGYFLV